MHDNQFFFRKHPAMSIDGIVEMGFLLLLFFRAARPNL